MFRVSILETALACGVIVLVILVPLIVARAFARTNQRLNDIEHKLPKKK
jgi:hypothetical protein